MVSDNDLNNNTKCFYFSNTNLKNTNIVRYQGLQDNKSYK